MAKVVTIVTITLIFLTMFLGVLTYFYKKTALTTTTKIIVQPPTQAPQSECALIMSPEEKITQAGTSNSIDVTIGSDGDYPTEVQLEISYDPTALTNVSLVPGDFLPNAKVLLNNVDTATGRISYALILPPDQQALHKSGTVAHINFIPNGTKSETQILFLPKTTVYAHKQPSILKQAQGANIVVSLPPKTASQSSQLNHFLLPKTTLAITPSAK